ncbi:hypothetical protein CBB2_3373 [Clostridium botulinum]|nr:hypothetical protein CBB2_3373 [Clostridium botulinum]
MIIVKKMDGIILDLNTSHVNVQLDSLRLWTTIDIDLNTSHVNVQF